MLQYGSNHKRTCTVWIPVHLWSRKYVNKKKKMKNIINPGCSTMTYRVWNNPRYKWFHTHVHCYDHSQIDMSLQMIIQQNDMCVQQRFRSAWASALSDQTIRCPHKERLGPQLPIKCTAKSLIRLSGSPGWSESSLGAHVFLLVLSCGGSYILFSDYETLSDLAETSCDSVRSSTIKLVNILSQSYNAAEFYFDNYITFLA